jgi:hypothetical protein
MEKETADAGASAGRFYINDALLRQCGSSGANNFYRRDALLFSPPASFAEEETNRHPVKPQAIAEKVGQVALVGKMDALGVIGNHGEQRGPVPSWAV